MPFYYTLDEAFNCPKIPKELVKSIITGHEEVCRFISNLIVQHTESKKKSCLLALDGFLGVQWESIIREVKELLKKEGLKVTIIDISSCYKSSAEIKEIVAPLLNFDPSFGFVFSGGLECF